MFKNFLISLIVLFLTLTTATTLALIFISTERGQRWLQEKIVGSLSKKLNTRVSVKHIGISLTDGCLILEGTEIDDLKAQPMLRVDTLQAVANLSNIWHREIFLNEVRLYGADIKLYKERPDTAANYQFLIDAFKKDSVQTTEKKKPFIAFKIDLKCIDINRTDFSWHILSDTITKKSAIINPNHIDLKGFSVRIDSSFNPDSMKQGMPTNVTLSELSISEPKQGLKFAIDKATLHYQPNSRSLHTEIDSLRLTLKSNRPRKNKGKPNRGWFDPGHIDLTANINADILQQSSADGTPSPILFNIHKAQLRDRESSLDIRKLTTNFTLQGKVLKTDTTRLSLPHTTISLTPTTISLLQDKQQVIRLETPCLVNARVTLSDIARPFAPRLSDFTTPLTLSTQVSGTLKRLLFNNILITTPDGRLRLTAQGDLCETMGKKNLSLHFSNIHLKARRGIKEQIVKHFAKHVKLKMMKQLAAIGDIEYTGNVGIFYKREVVSGSLITKYGNIGFHLNLDGTTKLLTGNLTTPALDFGAIMNIKGLYIGKANASYSFNISKKMKSKTGGRLPQGWLKAQISDAKYGIIGFKDIDTDLKSDGTDAIGTITTQKKYINIICDVVYHQTDKEQYFRIKPHMNLKKGEKKVSSEDKKNTKTADTTKTTEKKGLFKKIGSFFSRKK